MEKKICCLIFFCLSFYMQSQTVAINEVLLGQHSANSGVRLASGFLQQERFQNAKEAYDKTNEYAVQILVVKQKIFNSMTNIENAFLNGKQMKATFDNIWEIIDEVNELKTNLWDTPDIIIFRSRYLNHILEQSIESLNDIYSQVSKVSTDHLVDHYQRQALLNSIQGKILHIRNQLRGLNFLMRNYKNFNILRKMPTLNHYVNKDKAMFNSILRNFKYLKDGN